MARNPRVVVPGYACHLTQRGSNRQPVFLAPEDRSVYLRLMDETMHDAGIRLLCYCLMTNHVHFVAIPHRGDSLSVWMRRLSGRYAQYFNAKTCRSGHLWQGRFYSCMLSPNHLTVALRYVEQNPVRANLVRNAEDYPWSSARAHLTGQMGGMLDVDAWLGRGSEQGWAAMLNGVPPDSVVHLLKRCTFGGRPFGGADFVTEIEAKSARLWRRWPYQQELKDSEVLLSLEGLDAVARSSAA